MAQKLDSIDQQILNLLSQDGRLTCAEIARAVGNISERSVRYRVDRLISEKVIDVRGMIDPRSFGFSVIADVTIEVDPGQILEIAKSIAGYDQVTYVACRSSGSEICARLVARDNNDLFQFTSEVLGKIPGVKKITTAITPVIVKDAYTWKVPASYFEQPQ